MDLRCLRLPDCKPLYGDVYIRLPSPAGLSHIIASFLSEEGYGEIQQARYHSYLPTSLGAWHVTKVFRYIRHKVLLLLPFKLPITECEVKEGFPSPPATCCCCCCSCCAGCCCCLATAAVAISASRPATFFASSSTLEENCPEVRQT